MLAPSLDQPPKFMEELDLPDLEHLPESVWVLQDRSVDKYACFFVDEKAVIIDRPLHCICIFRTEQKAKDFIHKLPALAWVPYNVSLEEAREIAINKDKDGLALMDDWNKPTIHYVKFKGS